MPQRGREYSRKYRRGELWLQVRKIMREDERFYNQVEQLAKKFKAMLKKVKTETQRKELSAKYHKQYDALERKHKKILEEIGKHYRRYK